MNELVEYASYLIEEFPVNSEGNQLYGHKIKAKNLAEALKHYVKTKTLTELKKVEKGNEKMDVPEDDSTQSPLP